MKILYLTPYNPNIKTPETGYCEQLSNRGHKVTFSFGYNPELLTRKDEYDIVFGAMEYSMNMATWLGKKLNIPIYNHIEWIPPWRTGQEDPKDWGYDGTTVNQINKIAIQHWTPIYIEHAMDWENSTIRSIAGECLKQYLIPWVTKPLKTEIKYYAADFEALKKYKCDEVKKKYQIMSTARLVPHKRIAHVIKALAFLKNPPAYKLVGYGNEYPVLQKLADDLGVKVDFVGPGQNGVKELIIQESMFSVNIWAGLPMAESFYYKKPAITYDEHHIREVFGNSPEYVERNNVKQLAEKIQFMIDNKKYRVEKGEKAYELMMGDKINMGTPDKLMENLERIMNKGIDIYERT